MIAATLLAACSSSTGLEATTGTSTAITVTRFGVSSSAQLSGANENQPIRTTIGDNATWTAFWATLAGGVAGGVAGGAAPIPTVDFASNMVIVAVTAVRPTGGYSVQIERVTEYADYIEAAVVEGAPGAGCLTSQALTRPVDVVQVPRRDKPVRFTVRSATNDCGTARVDSVAVGAGKTVTVGSVRVTLRTVVSDGRCPSNVMCIWEGDAAVALRFESAGATSDVTLHTNVRGGVVSAVVGGREFRLVGLTPYPSGQTTPASAYTALLVVR